MTDGSTSSGHAGSYGNASGSGSVPRRMSYASVASGAASQGVSNTYGSGAFVHMATTTPNHSYPPSHSGHLQRYPPEQNENSVGIKKQEHLPKYSRKYSGLPGFGSRHTGPTFIVPSYLRDSRYVAKLEALNTQKSRSERESKSGLQSGVSSVNQSPSNLNVHRIAPSHRGMTYEVIESNPPKDEDLLLLPLPTRWNEQDKYPGLEVSADGLEAKYGGSASKSDVEAASVRADYPMSPACGIYYYEVEIKSKSKECAVAVGFSTQKASLERLPGWEPESWAYHSDDGKTFCGEHNGRPYGPSFAADDIVGCGINFNTGHAFFTKNGQDMGVAFREMRNVKPYPCVGIKKYSGAVVSVNFGQVPFVFDIDEKVAQEKLAVENQVKKTTTTNLHPKLDETSLVQELVAQFLIHGGYVETSKAFGEEVNRGKRSLNGAIAASPSSISENEATHASNRQQIRRAILAGDIDLAFDITNRQYPEVLQRSPKIVFHLKCRKWIELLSKASDLRNPQDSTNAVRRTRKSSNGFGKPSVTPENMPDVFDQHMELDEEQQATMNGTGKAPVISPGLSMENDIAYSQLMAEAMEYGQILQREYKEKGDDYNDTLKNIFSLIVYYDPRESTHGHLLDHDGRMKVAEELNSAILVSLGRSPTAALENAYKQTEALLDVLGTDGGPASFLNLKAVFDERRDID